MEPGEVTETEEQQTRAENRASHAMGLSAPKRNSQTNRSYSRRVFNRMLLKRLFIQQIPD